MTLRLFYGEALLAIKPADIERPDLTDAGIVGAKGFRFPILELEEPMMRLASFEPDLTAPFSVLTVLGRQLPGPNVPIPAKSFLGYAALAAAAHVLGSHF